MKKIILTIMLIVFLSLTVHADLERRTFYAGSNDDEVNINTGQTAGTTFKTSSGQANIAAFNITIRQSGGITADVVFFICNNWSNGVSGCGSVIAQRNVSASNITSAAGGNQINITFPPGTVNASQTYYGLLNNPAGSGGTLYLRRDNSAPSYPNGSLINAAGNPLTGFDLLFYTYEEVAVADANNNSMKMAKFNISDSTISGTSWITVQNVSFNTSTVANFSVLSSFNVEKLSGSGSNQVYVRLLLDGTVIEQDQVSTVTTNGDEKSSGLSIQLDQLAIGEHTYSLQAREEGAGFIELNDIDFVILKGESDDDNPIYMNDIEYSTTHSSTSFSAIDTTLISSNYSSPMLYLGSLFINDSSSIGSYKYGDTTNARNGSIHQRELTTEGNVGSFGICWLDQTPKNQHNFSLYGRTNNNSITINGTTLALTLSDNATRINYGLGSNSSTNDTSNLTVTAGTNRMARATLTVQDGDAAFVSATISVDSPTNQDIVVSINNSVCSTKKDRTMSATGGIGNIFIYFECDGLSAGNHDFDLYLENTANIVVTEEHIRAVEGKIFSVTEEEPAPMITFNNVTTSLGTTALTNNVVIEYASGVWTWDILVADGNLDHYNVTFFNSTGSMFTYSDLNETNQTFNTSDSTFRDFGNPYNITISAVDDLGQTSTDTLVFNITDTTDPTITWTTPLDTNTTIQYDNLTYCFDVTFNDQSLYSYHFNTSNTDTFAVLYSTNVTTGLTPTSYQYQRCVTYNATGTYFARAYTCDAHTAKEIGNLYSGKDSVRDGLEFVDDNILIYSRTNGVTGYTANKKFDRYEFDYNYSMNHTILKFVVASNYPIVRRDSDYLGHLIIGDKYWIDFEEFDANSVMIKDETLSGWNYSKEITINFKSSKNKFKFKSLGELNCVEEVSSFQLLTSPVIGNLTDVFQCGEKLLDDNISINSIFDETQGCTLRNNEYFIAQNNTNCTIVTTLEYFFGENIIELQYNNGTSDYCHVWKDDVEKGFDEYMYYIMLMLIIGFLFCLGMVFQSAAIMLLGAVVTIFSGLQFYGISYLIGIMITLAGILMLVLMMNRKFN